MDEILGLTKDRCAYGACRGRIEIQEENLSVSYFVRLRVWSCIMCGREAKPAELYNQHGKRLAVQRSISEASPQDFAWDKEVRGIF